MSLAAKLRALREQAGLSQGTMAQRLSIGLSAYGHWENGRSEPAISYLKDIAKIFKISLDELCEYVPESANDDDGYASAKAVLKNKGIRATLNGNDVVLDVYGTEYSISRQELPNMVQRAEMRYRRMMRNTTREMFAAAVILEINDEHRNQLLTDEYLKRLLFKIDDYYELNDGAELTPAVLAGFMYDRLMLMSKKSRVAAWKQALEYIDDNNDLVHDADYYSRHNFDDTSDDYTSIPHYANDPAWEYPNELFK